MAQYDMLDLFNLEFLSLFLILWVVCYASFEVTSILIRLMREKKCDI